MLRPALLAILLLMAANFAFASPDFDPHHSLYVMAYRLTNRMNHPDPPLVDDLLRKVDSALQVDPENTRLAEYKAWLLLQRRQYAEAQRILETLYSRDLPPDLRSKVTAGLLHIYWRTHGASRGVAFLYESVGLLGILQMFRQEIVALLLALSLLGAVPFVKNDLARRGGMALGVLLLAFTVSFPVSELLISGAPFTPHLGERALIYVVSYALEAAVLLGTGFSLLKRLSLQASLSEAKPQVKRWIFVGWGLVAVMMLALFAHELQGTTGAWLDMALEHSTHPFWLWVAISVLAVSVGRTVWEIGVVYRTLRHTAGLVLAFAFTTAFHLFVWWIWAVDAPGDFLMSLGGIIWQILSYEAMQRRLWAAWVPDVVMRLVYNASFLLTKLGQF